MNIVTVTGGEVEQLLVSGWRGVNKIGLDIEARGDGTNLVHPAHQVPVLVQIAHPSLEDVYVVTSDFQRLKCLSNYTWIGHNLSYDISMLRHHYGIEPKAVWDTMVMEGILSAGYNIKSKKFSLEHLVAGYLGKARNKHLREEIYSGANLTQEHIEYAAEDALDAVKISKMQAPLLDTCQPAKRVRSLENKLVPVISEMVYRGVRLDKVKWAKHTKRRIRKLSKIDEELSLLLTGYVKRSFWGDTSSTINLNSHTVLKKTLKSEGIVIPNTQRQTLESAFALYPPNTKKRKILELLAERSVLQHAVSSFGLSWLDHVSPKTGRLIPSIFQTKPETGRMSGSKPYVLNIPKSREYRECFIPDEGRVLIKADYSQQEARIMAYLSHDKRLLDGFAQGVDPYVVVARVMFEDNSITKQSPARNIAKTIVLALFYGMGIEKLAAQLGETVQKAGYYMSTFKKMFPGPYLFAERVVEEAELRGYAETVLGRRRFGDPTDPGFTGKMRNLPVQGTAADMLKLAALIAYPELKKMGAYIVLMVHDEILVESPIEYASLAAQILRDSMLLAAKLLVDVVFDVDISAGFTWGSDELNIAERIV